MGCALTTKQPATLANTNTIDEKEREVGTKGERENCVRKATEREQQLTQGKKWRLSGDDRQGTPPRTISASIARIPPRKVVEKLR